LFPAKTNGELARRREGGKRNFKEKTNTSDSGESPMYFLLIWSIFIHTKKKKTYFSKQQIKTKKNKKPAITIFPFSQT